MIIEINNNLLEICNGFNPSQLKELDTNHICGYSKDKPICHYKRRKEVI